MYRKLTHKTRIEKPNARNRRFGSTFALGVLIALIALTTYVMFERGRPVGWAHPKPASVMAASVPPPKPVSRQVLGSFAPRQNITEALRSQGLSDQLVQDIVESTRPVYNLAKVKANRPYSLTLSPEGEFRDFQYGVDDDRRLRVYRDGERLVPKLENVPYETRVEPISGVIEGSLFEAITGVGEQDRLALDFAGIFMWDVDFYTDIQNGDSFHILVEKKYLDGQFKKYGAILAADIINQNRTVTGFRFENEYYGPDGKALKKSFLKSPLKFARISSTFSRARFHPVLKVMRPHLGVDYAAPVGTPVVAVGTGTVTSAGQSGGSGKLVRLRHSGGYETMYLHLSRIAVRTGAHVAQGQVIGYVGATGLATGPHLDFRVVSHGNFVNPTKVLFPPAPPVSQGSFTQFASLRDSLQARLRKITLSSSE